MLGNIIINFSNTVERALETLCKTELLTVLNWLLFRN